MSLWDNSKVIGKRRPYYMEYEAGFDDTGRLLAIKMEIYADAGCQTQGSRNMVEIAKWLDSSMCVFYLTVMNSYHHNFLPFFSLQMPIMENHLSPVQNEFAGKYCLSRARYVPADDYFLHQHFSIDSLSSTHSNTQ